MLETDASKKDLEFSLWRILVAYVSHSLSPSEKNYPIAKHETLVIEWAISLF